MSSNPFKSFANIFKPGDDVDEEDDYTPDEMYDEEPRRRRGQRGQGSYDDEDEDDYDEDEPRKPKASVFGRPSQPQGRDRDQQQSHPDVKPSSLVDAGQEVRVFKPTNLVEARKVTDTLLSEQSAILNLEASTSQWHRESSILSAVLIMQFTDTSPASRITSSCSLQRM